MPDAIEELKERTSRPLRVIDKHVTTSTQRTKSGMKDKSAVSETKQEPVAMRQNTPNPYEEKFHSEFCFISLILGIFGLILPFFSTLAIIFGIGGLMQTHRERMKGRWMAITGIVLGFLGIILIIAAIILGLKFLEGFVAKWSVQSLLGNV